MLAVVDPKPVAGKTIFKGSLKGKKGFEGIGISHNHDDSSCLAESKLERPKMLERVYILSSSFATSLLCTLIATVPSTSPQNALCPAR